MSDGARESAGHPPAWPARRGPPPHERPPAPLALSLVVCTRNRGARLPETLRALAAVRSAHAWELVLVDNGSTDETPRILRDFAAVAPVPVTLVHERRAGLANARNAGVAAARAPILAFTDDDCYPEPDFVDRWLDVFTDRRVGYGAGRILLHDPADAPVTIRTDPAPRRIRPRSHVRAGLVQGANMAFRREVLETAGGFDPALGPGAPFNCEDVDIAARASALGFEGGYFPGPVVRHHHRRRPGPELERLLHSYDHGRGAYWASLLLRPGSRRYALRDLAVSAVRKPWPALRRELAGMREYLAWHRATRRGEAPEDRRRRPALRPEPRGEGGAGRANRRDVAP